MTFVGLAVLGRCSICRERVAEVDDWRFVTLPDGGEGVVCWRCIEQGDIETPVTYEEEGDDD